MKIASIRCAALAAAALVALASPAFAQTQPWNTNITDWSAPTRCVDGQPITACPVTNYQVERAPAASGPWTFLATTTALTYAHANAAAGVNCYRGIAVTATGASAPTAAACKTNTAPTPPLPNPPGDFRLRTVAIAALGGMSPVYSVTGKNELGTFYGLIPAGRECMQAYAVKGALGGEKYYRVAFDPRELWRAPPAGVNLAAACG
jgi:hypothetical protein